MWGGWGERMDGQTIWNKKIEKWPRIQVTVVEGLDTDRRYGTSWRQRWCRRFCIAHEDMLEGVRGGRKAGGSMWPSAHEGK